MNNWSNVSLRACISEIRKDSEDDTALTRSVPLDISDNSTLMRSYREFLKSLPAKFDFQKSILFLYVVCNETGATANLYLNDNKKTQYVILFEDDELKAWTADPDFADEWLDNANTAAYRKIENNDSVQIVLNSGQIPQI